ncbi:MAG TPA: NAD(P)H-hydrate dehydratase [Gaiellaceae bacterium]|jgi:NAD(P)H-hydrate epimerase|nr:NAD(P)H-hydrate dehydratase [Gaiellaceae bacterium]
MLEPLYTAAEMRAAEEAYPGSVEELMERAGRAVALHALEDFGNPGSFTVVCGSGSNGGDGRVAARALEEEGREVMVVEAKPEDEEKDLGDPDVLVDALFGTGFEGEPRPGAARLIEQMNALGCPIIAVDLPSGVDASTGEVAGAAIDADMTVTFHGEKVGHHVTPGAHLAGYLETADIGLDPAQTLHARTTREIIDLVPRRAPEDNKYTAGHVVVVGGSPGMTGAPCLSALAAFRSDAGYVTLAGPEPAVPVFERWVLEAVKRPLPTDDGGLLTGAAVEPVLELVGKAGALAVGPGLGRSDGTKALVRRLLAEAELPAVVDGDALWELEPEAWPAPRVLTPHSGELARILDVESAWVDAHRLEALSRAVERFRCVVLLKGSGTLVGAPGKGAIVCGGFPTLATAGTGDILTGIVAAFLAKGVEPRLAAATAATAQHWAAIEAPQKDGLIASDLLDALPRALSR